MYLVGRNIEKDKPNEDSKQQKTSHLNLLEGIKKLQRGEVDDKLLTCEDITFEAFFELLANIKNSTFIFSFSLEKVKEFQFIENRIRLMIENLIERRKENWKDRLFANEGPKKIEQLHNEYEREQQEIDQRASEFAEKERENYSYTRRTNTSYFSKESKQSFQGKYLNSSFELSPPTPNPILF